MKKIGAAIIGPGNIGTDLMYKILRRSEYLDLKLMVGRRAESNGIRLAKESGIDVSISGIESVIHRNDIKIVFDATLAREHEKHAPLLKRSGKIAIDLTPAAIGPYVMPIVNLSEHIDKPNVNLITCGGQATIPIVYAISRVVRVKYAEIVATIASKSAGQGTRQSIDEFTQTTAKGIVKIGGAEKGKAIILLNPAEPPMIMNNTIYAFVEEVKKDEIIDSVQNIVEEVKAYVPGYNIKISPTFDGNKVTVMVTVKGSGDYLPVYSGNLDIETCAALAIGDKIAYYILTKST